jgi:hypothetical protein
MNFTFFCSYDELMSVEGVEIKAHTTRKSVEKDFFLISEVFVYVHYQLKFHYFFRLKLVFQQNPVGDSAI